MHTKLWMITDLITLFSWKMSYSFLSNEEPTAVVFPVNIINQPANEVTLRGGTAYVFGR